MPDLYLHVFQPALREIGRLWQTRAITVAHEHFATAATQAIMGQLYPAIFAAERRGLSMVATCVGGEQHEIGIRMVADFFEMAGWDSHYLGANTPADSVVRSVRERGARVLAVSATITAHVGRVAALIAAVRAEPGEPPHVLVGGYPFNLVPDLWKTVGADAFAPGAEEAVAIAERLIRPVAPDLAAGVA
ncbi:cobalamin B12-binding domain-containing protein [Azospirillum brasilense]|uniref:cobalamin B12-binding domain-containing protein n=1 Tax=Azospirillum brasilense TaxID=192 RepID=UPI00039E2FF5|nr:cobalamin-dependent protein [Azospirillum brasilense]